MKSFFNISILLLLPFFAGAQKQEKLVDSLRNVLHMATTDSARFSTASQLLFTFYESNRDSAIHYIEICISIAEKNNMLITVAEGLALKGFQIYHLGRYGEALKCLLRATKIANDPANEKKIFTPGKYPDLRKKRLSVLAMTHLHMGHLIGATNDSTGQIFYYNESKKLAAESGDTGIVAFANMNLGSIYFDLGKLDSALQLEQTALALMLKQKNGNIYIGSVYEDIGNIYRKKEDKTKAVENWLQGIAWHKKQNHQRGIADICGAMTSFYMDEKNKDSSLYYARKRLAVLRQAGLPNLGGAYTNLYKSFELNGNKDSAYVYSKLALEATEKSLSERTKNLGEFQKEAFKEQEQLQQLEEEKIESKNRLRNYALLGVLGVFLIVGFFLYRNNRQKQKANKILQEQKDKVESTLQELKSTQAQLIQSEKMASLGELTAGIAHEIQNPLNFVNNFSEVNNELVAEAEEELEMLNAQYSMSNAQGLKDLLLDIKDNSEKINHHGQRASIIVKGMLEHSRKSSGKKTLTDINALCDEFLRLSYHGLRAKDQNFQCEFKLELDPNMPMINVVSQDIARVLLNIINNAFQACAENLVVPISIGMTTIPPKDQRGLPESQNEYKPFVSVSTKYPGDKVEIAISDNGPGIPDAIKGKIFQPFFTTKPTGQGTGLGLSLAYDIIKAHGGEIKLDSSSNGSVFTIQLPIDTF